MSVTEPPIPPDPSLPIEPTDDAYGSPEDAEAASVEQVTAGAAKETVNLAATLPKKKQDEYANRIVDDYERDRKSGEKFRERRARIVRLALGDIPPPKDGEKFRLARIHYPIIQTHSTRIAVRIYDQQFPSNGEYWGVKPNDALDLERSIRVAKHMNWQTAHQIPEYVPNHDVNIAQMTLYGSSFTFVYWDQDRERICHEVCATDDIILPYTWKRGKNDPSMSEFPRITYIRRYYRHEIGDKADRGIYANTAAMFKAIDEGQTGGSDSETNTPQKLREVVDRNDGTEKQSDDPDAPRVILFQVRWFKLPGEKRSKPVTCEVDLGTRTLVSLKLREDEDPVDKARFNREKRANDLAHEAAMAEFAEASAMFTQMPNHQMMGTGAATAAWPGIGDRVRVREGQGHDEMTEGVPGTVAIVDGAAIGIKFDGMDTVHKWYVAEELEPADEQTMTQPPMQGETTSTGPAMKMPQPPQHPGEPAPVKMVPIHFFTHYIYEPNPEGAYGLGVGMLLEGANIAADTLASQIIDTATLSNTPTGYRSRQAKIRGGEFRIVPGEILETDLSPEELKSGGGIHLLKFPPPEPMLRQMIQDQIAEGEKLSGAGDILSGEVEGSNITATQVQAQMSAALSQISIVNKRYTRARTSEGQKIARLNSVYLPNREAFTATDPMNQEPPSEVFVGRGDYLEDTHITVTADPRMASQPQRFNEAMQAIQATLSLPVGAQNIPLQVALLKNLYVSGMDRPDFVVALEQGLQMPPMGGAPPQPGAPPGPPGQEPGAPTPPPGVDAQSAGAVT